MPYPFSIIAVFTDTNINYRGNTAAVVTLDHEISISKMQQIAADFNQPATTFLWKANQPNSWHVRWFAPDGEIQLCGHGAMAAVAYLSWVDASIELIYRQGVITGQMINEHDAQIKLTAIPSNESSLTPVLESGIGEKVNGYFINENKHIVLLENEDAVLNMQPNFQKLRESSVFGYIVTAQGNSVDFVSRTIVPHVKQLEDHATGSSHAALTPFWAKKLNKSTLIAHQLSERGGVFKCSIEQKMVTLTGQFITIAKGNLKL